MKLSILSSVVAALLICLTSCNEQQQRPPAEKPPPRKPTIKSIAAKQQALERRFTFEFFSDPPLAMRSVTVYYLIATDGTATEVGMSDYVATHVESDWAAFDWKHHKK